MAEFTMIDAVFVNGSVVKPGKISADEVQQPNWETCIVPTKCGIPLKVKRIRERKPSEQIDRDLAIFLMVEEESGMAPMKWQTGCGLLVFARSDRKNFTVDEFYQVYDFCFELMDDYGETNGSQLAKRKMNPTFYNRFQQMRCQETIG